MRAPKGTAVEGRVRRPRRPWRAVALVAATSLVMTPVVPQAPAAAQPKAPVPVRDLPGIASPPAPTLTPPVPERLIENPGLLVRPVARGAMA